MRGDIANMMLMQQCPSSRPSWQQKQLLTTRQTTSVWSVQDGRAAEIILSVSHRSLQYSFQRIRSKRFPYRTNSDAK